MTAPDPNAPAPKAMPNPAPWANVRQRSRRLQVIRLYPDAKAIANGVANGEIILPGRDDLSGGQTPNCFIRVIPWKKYSWAMQIVYEYEHYQED